ncbi:glucose 1-dehydrogenase [Streptomyces sp. SID11385]|uniref:SDR family NAD(P)-dependent oxidoreductase n=1 Tax=Streptomyces sp. SID11385 TaxID=2706031 RepID=UPI0013C876C1|nr:glucose 1-dehydrogenase [Streptomyces sp. SID11385]NEA38596.1 glucose 1-dehydrogenase [Streptomyces sp. SID11385]
MPELLKDKVVVITGAASGNGRAMALRFAEEGAKAIVVADVRETPREGGATTVELVEEQGARAVFVPTDVTDRAQVRAAVAAAGEFGGLDVFVNNAGITRFEEDPLATEDAVFDLMMNINVKGAWIGSQEAVRDWTARGVGGSLINLSSIGGIQGSRATPLYSASKGAIRLLTYSFADAYGAKGIRVNAIHPGLVDTEMIRTDLAAFSGGGSIPMERLARPREIADAAVFLASDLSTYANGSSLVVDGGFTTSM